LPPAVSAAQGRALYDTLLRLARERHPQVAAGEFGADMQVALVNDGPVTIPLRVA
jgi:D-aminoacyl-tRNA deacylase